MTVSVECYVVIGRKKGKYSWGTTSMRMTKNKPALDGHEIALHLDLTLPDALFEKPSLSAKVVIPDGGATYDLSAEVQANIAAAVKQATGITLHITAPEPDASEGGSMSLSH